MFIDKKIYRLNTNLPNKEDFKRAEDFASGGRVFSVYEANNQVSLATDFENSSCIYGISSKELRDYIRQNSDSYTKDKVKCLNLGIAVDDNAAIIGDYYVDEVAVTLWKNTDNHSVIITMFRDKKNILGVYSASFLDYTNELSMEEILSA